MDRKVIPKVLVMGGTTFVSRCIAIRLINKGYAVDIMTRGKKVIDYSGFHEHIICDRRKPELLKRALKGRNYEFILDINARYGEDIQQVLNSIYTSYLHRYILCSTGSVYTFEEGIVDENSKRLSEEHDNPYGINKKNAEDVLIASDVPYVIIRPTYIYGEYNEIPRETFIFNAIEKGIPLEICRDRNTRINLIYVEELAEIFISSIETKGRSHCYNACNEEIVTFEKYIKYCEEIVGKQANIVYYQSEKKPSNISFPYAECTLLMSNKKLVEDGLYVPQISLKEGLYKTYQWFKRSGIMFR